MNLKESKYKNYTDRIDVNFDITLHEYGVIRNPKTDHTIFCLNPCDNYEMNEDFEYEYEKTFITLEDVREILEEIEDGYFSFIGSDKNTEIVNLDNDCLSHHIQSINQYNGYFREQY